MLSMALISEIESVTIVKKNINNDITVKVLFKNGEKLLTSGQRIAENIDIFITENNMLTYIKVPKRKITNWKKIF